MRVAFLLIFLRCSNEESTCVRIQRTQISEGTRFTSAVPIWRVTIAALSREYPTHVSRCEYVAWPTDKQIDIFNLFKELVDNFSFPKSCGVNNRHGFVHKIPSRRWFSSLAFYMPTFAEICIYLSTVREVRNMCTVRMYVTCAHKKKAPAIIFALW